MGFETNERPIRRYVAFVGPMALFLLLLALGSGLRTIGGKFWLAFPDYWIYPLQTLACAALLAWYRHEYPLSKPRSAGLAIAIGAAVFAVWIAPQVLLSLPPRRVGFDPNIFAAEPFAYWATIILRFVRLVVVVPLLEEIFWRGFLLRYLLDERFWRVPFGAFSWFSFAVVTVAFALFHSPPDWPAALICGAAYNLLAYRTRNLVSCVLAHATTNLLLGIWIMRTEQWGFW